VTQRDKSQQKASNRDKSSGVLAWWRIVAGSKATMKRDYFDANRRAWDERTQIHARDTTGFYAVENVLAGEDKLGVIEAAEIGNIAGLHGVHLQCHFGLDTICLSRRGARMTGLDFSPEAIRTAREMAAKTGQNVEFIEANVYDARSALKGEFDFAYVTWGAINWLPDIAAWAKTVASLLKPGGWLYLLEGHPVTLCLEQIDGKLVPHFPYRSAPETPIVNDNATTYNGDPAILKNQRMYEWMHPLSDIQNGLIEAGMRIDWLHEHDSLAWTLFPMMRKSPDGNYRLPPEIPHLPLAFSLRASRA
jgi:SAM-dependent methyltransferase